jgi:hypothetical protein
VETAGPFASTGIEMILAWKEIWEASHSFRSDIVWVALKSIHLWKRKARTTKPREVHCDEGADGSYCHSN